MEIGGLELRTIQQSRRHWLKLLFVPRELTVSFLNYHWKPWIFPGFLGWSFRECKDNSGQPADSIGAPGRTRTSTMFPPPDFESGASTNSATGASSRPRMTDRNASRRSRVSRGGADHSGRTPRVNGNSARAGPACGAFDTTSTPL